MPRLEEVVIYVQGLWLLISGREEGFRYLDLSDRGFWRSWWSIVWCLPPMLLNYEAIKWSILTSDDLPLAVGSGFYTKMLVIDIGSTFVSSFALIALAYLGGFGQHAKPIITALNWLSVPIQWAFSVDNLIELYLPGGDSLSVLTTIGYLITTALLSYRIIARIVGSGGLAPAASVLTLFIVPILVNPQLAALLGLIG